MKIRIKSRHGLARLQSKEPPLCLIDVTSRGPQPWVRFSPFFPLMDIPVPFSPGTTSASVEGLWQGLKVFVREDIDRGRFANTTMRKLKRTVRKYGKCQGHREGVDGERLLGYREARWRIYVPTYLWVLENRLQREVAELRALAEEQEIVLLDYETNTGVDDLRKPLSHAGLLAAYLQDRYPTPPAEFAGA